MGGASGREDVCESGASLVEVFDSDGRSARCYQSVLGLGMEAAAAAGEPGSGLGARDIIQEAAKTRSEAACARKKLGRGWVGVGVGGGERSFPTAAREGPIITIFGHARSPCKAQPKPQRSLGFHSAPLPSPALHSTPPPSPSVSLPRAGTSTRELRSGGEKRRPGGRDPDPPLHLSTPRRGCFSIHRRTIWSPRWRQGGRGGGAG